MARTIFRNANLLDGLEGPRRAVVIVEGEKIAAVVGHGDAAPPAQEGDVVYELDGKTLMPGMVAGHGHLSFHGLSLFKIMDADMSRPAPYMGVLAAQDALRTLQAGFTSYVGAGCVHNMDVVLKQLIGDGVIQGPRIVPCSRDFVPTGHAVDYKPETWNVRPSPLGTLGAICDGPDEFRKEIRKEAKRGVEMIKLYPEGGHGLPTRTTRLSELEIRTVVETATLCGLRVRVHAYSKPTIRLCVEAGVAIVDHGDHLDDELADLFVEKGTFVLPSLYFGKAMTGVYHSKDDYDGWMAHARKSIAAGIAKGVRFVAGDDFGLLEMPHGENAKELALYVDEFGIDPREVLKWATVNGAAMMQRPDLGRIAEGMLADLVVVDGDPIARMGVLAEADRIAMVMQGGRIAKSTLATAPLR